MPRRQGVIRRRKPGISKRPRVQEEIGSLTLLAPAGSRYNETVDLGRRVATLVMTQCLNGQALTQSAGSCGNRGGNQIERNRHT